MKRAITGCIALAAAFGCGKKQDGQPLGPGELARFGAKGGNVYARQLVARDDGGYILAADTLDTATIGGITIKATSKERVSVVIALDASGKERWAHGFDGQCSGFHIAVHGTSTLFAGSCTKPIDGPNGPVSPASVDDHLHIFTAMLDDKGAVQWAHYAGNAGHQVDDSAALDAAGNAYVAGWFRDPIDFGTGTLAPGPNQHAGFIASFDPMGKARWAKSYPDAEVQAILAGPEELDIAGVFTNTTTVGTIQLTAATTEANKDRDAKGGRFIARLSPQTGEPASAALVGTDASSGQELARDAAGTLYDAADAHEGLVLFAIDKDNKSTPLHAVPLHGMGLMFDRPLVIDGKGRLLLEVTVGSAPTDFGGGPVEGSGTGDAVVVAYDPSGKYVGQTILQGPGADDSGGLAIAKDGTAVAAWTQQSGPPGQSYHDWLVTDVFYVTLVQHVPL